MCVRWVIGGKHKQVWYQRLILLGLGSAEGWEEGPNSPTYPGRDCVPMHSEVLLLTIRRSGQWMGGQVWRQRKHSPLLGPPALGPSNAYVQATLGVGSVNFRTLDFGSAFINWSECVLCVLSDTLVLRCMMFMFCVKEAYLSTIACLSRPHKLCVTPPHSCLSWPHTTQLSATPQHNWLSHPTQAPPHRCLSRPHTTVCRCTV